MSETAMAREIAQAPQAVARLLERNRPALAELAARLRQRPPPVVITCARGSSDHAASYLKYLVEILIGIPCCSIGASVVSIYGAKLNLANALSVTISQSGRSPDILALQAEARAAGALTLSMVNAEASPAASGAEIVLPLEAGPEASVAATKSFIASAAAAAALVAHWRADAPMIAAVERLPEDLARAVQLAWPEAEAALAEARSLYVLGRGPSLPIAQESALKLKETCALHAEAYSIAEVMHGPLELIEPGFPVLVYSPDDAARPSSRQAMARLRAAGARVLGVEPGGLAFAATADPLLDPISMAASFYASAEALARARGRDPDRPKLLKKVTETM